MTTSSSSIASHAESKSGSGRTLALFVGKADRYHQSSSLDDLSPRLIERYLRDVGSDLADETELPTAPLGRRMNIVSGPAEACFPKNAGLLFCNEAPHRSFRQPRSTSCGFPMAPAAIASRNEFITPQELTILSFPAPTGLSEWRICRPAAQSAVATETAASARL